jgi:hypothetical protein
MARTTIPAELVAVNAIQGTLIADNAITAVHIATNAISGTLIADNAITSTHIAENNVTATQIAMNTITVTQVADNAITTPKISADAVTGAKIANDSIDSEHLVDGSIDTAHIGDVQVTAAKLGDNAVTLAKMASLARGSIIVGDAAGDPAALAIGSNTYVLSSDGTDIAWAANDGITTINNNADNRVITGSGTANTLEGEANFVFDGTNVGIGTSSPSSLYSSARQLVIGDGSADVGMTIYTPSSGAGRIFFADGLSGGNQYAAFISYNHADQKMLFGTGSSGTTDVTIDQYGKVGIGTDNPTAPLHVAGNSYLIGNGYGIYGNADYANYSIATSGAGGVLDINWYGGIRFMTSGNVERMVINSAGNVSFSAPAAGTNKEITINGHNSKATRIKFAEAGVDKWLIGNGAASENGNFEIYASSGKNFTIAPATGTVTTSGPLSADSNATLIDTTVTGGNFVPGCAADTFHEITNIDWNGYFTDHKYAYFMVRLFWTSGVVDAGYNHRVTIMSPNHSSNATTSYAGVGSYTTSHTGYGTGDGRITPLIMASHHTGVIAIDQFKIDVKFDNVTASNGPLYMHVKTNRPPLASTAAVKIQVWRF